MAGANPTSSNGVIAVSTWYSKTSTQPLRTPLFSPTAQTDAFCPDRMTCPKSVFIKFSVRHPPEPFDNVHILMNVEFSALGDDRVLFYSGNVVLQPWRQPDSGVKVAELDDPTADVAVPTHGRPASLISLCRSFRFSSCERRPTNRPCWLC